jgi:hypothetical protein
MRGHLDSEVMLDIVDDVLGVEPFSLGGIKITLQDAETKRDKEGQASKLASFHP